MLSIKDAEDIILYMADIVHEMRYLRRENEELTLRNKDLENKLNGMYKSSQELTGKLFSAVINKTLEDIDNLS